jgi:hypothetical protein
MAPKNSPQPVAQLEPNEAENLSWYLHCRLRMYLELDGKITVDNWNRALADARQLAQESFPRHASDQAKHGYASVKK